MNRTSTTPDRFEILDYLLLVAATLAQAHGHHQLVMALSTGRLILKLSKSARFWNVDVRTLLRWRPRR